MLSRSSIKLLQRRRNKLLQILLRPHTTTAVLAYPSNDTVSSSILTQLELELQQPNYQWHRNPSSRIEVLKLHGHLKSLNWNISLTPSLASVVMQCYEDSLMMYDSLILYSKLDPSAKSSRICNGLLSLLLKSSRIDDALQVLDEMLEPEFEFLLYEEGLSLLEKMKIRNKIRPNNFAGVNVVGRPPKRVNLPLNLPFHQSLRLTSNRIHNSLIRNSHSLSAPRLRHIRCMNTPPENTVYSGPTPQNPNLRVTLTQLRQKHRDSQSITMVTAYDLCGYIIKHGGMVLPLIKYIQLHSLYIRKASPLHRIFRGHIPCEHLNTLVQKISTTSNSCERLPWERSTQDIILEKLKTALRNHEVNEAWEHFHDFKTLYGYPEAHLVNQLIVQLSYSSNNVWMRKTCDLVLQIVQESGSGLVHDDTLTKFALSLARLQMPALASVILRLMLDKGCVPPMHLLSLVFWHLVKTQIGALLASNYLSQVCDFYDCLKDKKAHRAAMVKPNALIFNIVLDACVRFKLLLKALHLVELIAMTGTVADVHSVLVISQILDMNGLRDEMRVLKYHVIGVSVPYVRHYRQFYDSLLSLHFKFNDIDAAAKLVLDMNSSHNCCISKEDRKYMQKSWSIAIGSHNLKDVLKIHIDPQLLQDNSVLKLEGRQDLIFYRDGKLVLSNRALVKFIIGYKKDRRISELSKLLLSIQEGLYSAAGSTLCSDVIGACIHLGWLESAHDILDDVEAAGCPMCSDTYMLLLSAYHIAGMQREAKGLLKQGKRVHLDKELADDAFDKHILYVETSNSPDQSDLAVALVQMLKDEDQTVSPLVYEFNSSIFFFCKARMIEDALKACKRMIEMNIQPTIQTYAYMLNGYSSLGMYREITIMWGEIKRLMKTGVLVADRELYELLLLNFLRGGYFERVLEVIDHMIDRNMYTDKWLYKCEFLRLHKNLYRTLKASNARTEAQSKRLQHVQQFRKWAGID